MQKFHNHKLKKRKIYWKIENQKLIYKRVKKNNNVTFSIKIVN